MKKSGIFGVAFAAVLFATVGARAATLAKYPFTGSLLSSTDTDPASTASDIVLGAGLTDTTRFAVANGNPAPALRVNTDETTGTSFATAVTAGDVFGFEITPLAGDSLTLNSLTFDLAVSSTAFTTNVRVELSANGTTYVPLGTGGSITGFNTMTFTAETIDLSGANGLLPTGSPIFVRFTVYDSANNANAYTAFDNIAVTGSSDAVPEPGTNAWLAVTVFGVVGGIVFRRRRAAA